jgi:hypothetical protein
LELSSSIAKPQFYAISIDKHHQGDAYTNTAAHTADTPQLLLSIT